MANIITKQTTRNSSSCTFGEIYDSLESENVVSSVDTCKRRYANPLAIASGFVGIMGVENASVRDLRHIECKDNVSLPETAKAIGVKQNSKLITNMVDSGKEFCDSLGTLKTFNVPRNHSMSTRSRQRTFVKHWMLQIYSELRSGCASNPDVIQATTADNAVVSGYAAKIFGFYAAMAYDATLRRTYILFLETPDKSLRHILKQVGFKSAGTYMLMYRDEGEDGLAQFDKVSDDFRKIVKNYLGNQIGYLTHVEEDFAEPVKCATTKKHKKCCKKAQ